jgi:hypothetical protein
VPASSGGKESSGQGFTIHSTNGIQNAPRPADHVHPTPVTGRRPTPAHYSHPPPKDHSQRYTCPCICTVATLVCFLAHHASFQVTWPERVAVAVALPESEFRATRETARLEFHSKSATSKNSNHVSTHSLLRPPNRFSLSQASTCIMPRKATQDLKWAWLVPTITSAT